MRIVLQRVLSASVTVEGSSVGEIGQGLMLFVGFGHEDSSEVIAPSLRKVLEMRVFSDENGKMNRSVTEIGGAILAISQFTLYANCARGRRPDFTHAAPPALAQRLYDEFVNALRATDIHVQTGIFAADMKVASVNDGPVTFNLEF